MKGRKPKPTALQIAEGDPRKIGAKKLRQKLESQPHAQRGYPDCPEHLKGLARKTYLFLVEQCEQMGIDRRPDCLMLEGAAQNYARAVAADSVIESEGATFEVKGIIGRGDDAECVVLDIKTRPEVAISDKCWKNLKSFASEFGFSPVSLTRLTIEKQDDHDADLMTMLSAPRAPRVQVQ